MNAPPLSIDYEPAWKEYRSLRRGVIIKVLLYMPVVGIVSYFSLQLFDTYLPAFVFAGIYMGWWIAAGFKLAQFSCPRCEWTFGGSTTVPFTGKGQHSKLKKFAPASSDPRSGRLVSLP